MWQLMAASTALSMYGNYMQGQSEAKSLLAKAEMTNRKSEESWRRYNYNAELEKENLRQTIGHIGTSAAAKGIGGQIVEGIEAYATEVTAKNLAEMRRQALWDRDMGNMEVSNLKRSAKSAKEFGFLKAFNAGLKGGDKTISLYDKATPEEEEEK